MTGLLRRRLEIELSLHTMEMNKEAETAYTKQQGEGVLVRRPTREAFAARVAGLRSVSDDLAVINSEIDTYKYVACVSVCAVPGGFGSGIKESISNFLSDPLKLSHPYPYTYPIQQNSLQVPALHLQKLRLRLDPLISEAMLSPPSSYRDAYQVN